MNFKSKKAGASVTELGLLAGLIAVLIIAAVNATGTRVSTLFSITGNSLNNINSKITTAKETPEPRIYSSCYDIKQDQTDASSGFYEIDPDGETGSIEPYSSYCDMTSDGGGYTMYSMTATEDKSSPEIEQLCNAIGLEVFVPRSRAHLTVAFQQFGGASLYLLGIYPKTTGARCDAVHFNSNECTAWAPTNGGHWYVEDYIDRTEPNGDNTPGYSMYYAYSASGDVTAYNDIPTSTSNPLNYSTRQWVCSSPEDKNIAKTW